MRLTLQTPDSRIITDNKTPHRYKYLRIYVLAGLNYWSMFYPLSHVVSVYVGKKKTKYRGVCNTTGLH